MTYNGPPRFAYTRYETRFVIKAGTEVTKGPFAPIQSKDGTELVQVQVSKDSCIGSFWTERKFLTE